MSSFHDSHLSWSEHITLLLNELCELLSNYSYDYINKSDIISKETQLYELVDEYVPRLLPDLDDFFDYIHNALRYDTPLEDEEIENFAMIITHHLHRPENYTQFLCDYSDEQSEYDPDIVSNIKSQIHASEREYISQVINSDQNYNDDREEETSNISRSERLALAKERKQNILNAIIAYLRDHIYPVSIDQIHQNVLGATRQLIEIIRKRPEIIDYKDKLLLGSKLKPKPGTIVNFKISIQEHYFMDKVHTSDEIFRHLQKKRNYLLQDLHIFNSFSLFSVVQYLYPYDFVFVRPRIALPGSTITKPAENITRYISSHYKTSIDDLREFIENSGYDLTVSLSLINKLPDVIMSDRKTVVAKSRLALSERQLQQIIDLIITELRGLPSDTEALAIRDLTCITQFPVINLPINEWLIYSILTKWNRPKKKSNLELYTFSTSPFLSRTIPIVSVQQTISKKTRQAIAAKHKGKADVSMTVDDLSDLDDLIEDEIEYDWDLEALEEEEETI